MTNWTANTIKTNGIRLHYQRTGGEKPPVVLCHGFSDCHLAWTRTAQALEDSFDLIMVDARGHGYSDKPASGYSAADHAADIAGLIEGLGLEKPALIGHSMGGRTVAQLAADYSQLASRIVLEDPPWRDFENSSGRPRDNMQQLIAKYQSMTREQIVELGRENNPTWDDEELWLWSLGKTLISPYVAKDGIMGLNGWREVAAKIASPALLVTANPTRGGIVTPETAAELTAMRTNIRVAYLDGAGHNIRRDQFAAYISAVRPFLQGQ